MPLPLALPIWVPSKHLYASRHAHGVPTATINPQQQPCFLRIVAIKVSNEHFSERFEREARAVGVATHPTGERNVTMHLTILLAHSLSEGVPARLGPIGGSHM